MCASWQVVLDILNKNARFVKEAADSSAGAKYVMWL